MQKHSIRQRLQKQTGHLPDRTTEYEAQANGEIQFSQMISLRSYSDTTSSIKWKGNMFWKDKLGRTEALSYDGLLSTLPMHTWSTQTFQQYIFFLLLLFDNISPVTISIISTLNHLESMKRKHNTQPFHLDICHNWLIEEKKGIVSWDCNSLYNYHRKRRETQREISLSSFLHLCTSLSNKLLFHTNAM